MLDLILKFSDWLWGIPMLVILVGGGIFLTIRLGFFQFRYLPFLLKSTFGKMFSKSEGEGTVSAFQAATAALASSIGASNIVGVPVAIATGGPGAIFWMWITALVGCASKYAEIVLGIKYRVKNEEGEYVGGPMYYLKNTKLPWLGVVFAFMLMVEIAPSISTQSISFMQTASTIGINDKISAVILIIVVGLVVYGGIKTIAKFTEMLVPSMAFIYLFCGVVVLLFNFSNIPAAFAEIFKGAFTPTAAMGGFAGATIAAVIRNGIARGVYSNEAGMGTASIAHSTATCEQPGQQGVWGIFEVFVDTIIVCTITALVVIVSGVWTQLPADQAAAMPATAFQTVFGKTIGGGIVSVAILLFVLSTIIVIVFYGEKQAEFLFGTFFSKIMRFVYIASIVAGVFLNLTTLYKLLDFMLALVIIPNMIGLVLLSGDVVKIKDEFFSNPKYYPGAKE